MSILRHSVLLILLLVVSPAWAGDLTVVSAGAPVVVLQQGKVMGTTPLTVSGLPEGPVELGFREAPLSATAFSQVVAVPGTGEVRLEVNLPERVANVLAVPQGSPVGAAIAANGAAATPGSVSAAAAPTPVAPAGDIYVTSTPPGAAIHLDGKPVDAATPYVIRGVGAGTHTVEARSTCGRATASLTVSDKMIARAELVLLERPGSLVVTGGAPNSRMFLDGADAGKIPVTVKDVSCGSHTVAIRAPGYLEATREVSVLGYEALNLVVTTGEVSLPGPVSEGTLHLTLRKEEFGTLVLDVTPLDTLLRVDGIEVGAGPRSVDKIAAGPHTVSGTLEGYSPQSVDIVVEPNAVSRATLTLVPETQKRPRPKAGLPGRIALNVGVSVIGLGASAYSATQFLAAGEAYDRYHSAPSDAEAKDIYAEEVAPSQTQAWVAAGVGGLGIIAASGLWITTDF